MVVMQHVWPLTSFSCGSTKKAVTRNICLDSLDARVLPIYSHALKLDSYIPNHCLHRQPARDRQLQYCPSGQPRSLCTRVHGSQVSTLLGAIHFALMAC